MDDQPTAARDEALAQLRALQSKVEALEGALARVEADNRKLLDIEEIKILQRSYGYYIEHFMADEIADCFADVPDVAVHLVGSGSYLGPQGIKDWLSTDPARIEPLFRHAVGSPEFYHGAMQLCPIVHIEPDGDTAHGRWYASGEIAVPMEEGIFYRRWLGVYENTYIRHGGKWKIKILKIAVVYQYLPEQGFVAKERLLKEDIGLPQPVLSAPDPGSSLEVEMPNYPSGYILPFHFAHPITGRQTSERARNAGLRKMGL